MARPDTDTFGGCVVTSTGSRLLAALLVFPLVSCGSSDAPGIRQPKGGALAHREGGRRLLFPDSEEVRGPTPGPDDHLYVQTTVPFPRVIKYEMKLLP